MRLKRLLLKGKSPLLIFLLVTLISFPAFSQGLTDITGHWAEESILEMVAQGIITGYEDGSFRPENPITRIEFLALVTRADKLEINSSQADPYWGKPYIDAAVEAGYILPDTFGSTSFEVFGEAISREEMASVVVRAYIAKGLEIDSNRFMEASEKLTDFNSGSAKYLDTSISAVALNLINGYPDGTFQPKGTTKRSEGTIVLSRYLNLINGTEPVSDVDGAHEFAPDHAFGTLSTPFSINHIEIGDSATLVQEAYGNPLRIDSSAYGFQWWIYHENYFNYFMVGVSGNRVVALYTATDLLESTTSLEMRQTKSEVTKALGSPKTIIAKAFDDYVQINDAGSAVYYKDKIYLTAYFDIMDSGRMFSVFLIDENMEKSMNSLYGSLTDSVRKAYEQQVFDLNNVYRTEHGKSLLKWSDPIAGTARKHSEDMAVRNFFDHNNPSGQSPFDRIAADGIEFSVAAENIAAGYPTPFGAHAGWVNSPGHRDNLLRNIEYLGVGVYFGGPYEIYYTQNYYTGR
jgi:uncharacterized protein YkwD